MDVRDNATVLRCRLLPLLTAVFLAPREFSQLCVVRFGHHQFQEIDYSLNHPYYAIQHSFFSVERALP